MQLQWLQNSIVENSSLIIKIHLFLKECNSITNHLYKHRYAVVSKFFSTAK